MFFQNANLAVVAKLISSRTQHAPGVHTFGSSNVLAVWSDRKEVWTAYLGAVGPIPFCQTSGNLDDLAYELALRGIEAAHSTP